MLPKNEKTFHVEIVGEKSKRKYEGEFTVKCVMTNAEEIEAVVRTDRYNQGSLTLPKGTTSFNRAVAELELRIKTNDKGEQLAPSWWRDSDGGRTLLDTSVVFKVWGEALVAEKEWTEGLAREADEAEAAEKGRSKKKEAKE